MKIVDVITSKLLLIFPPEISGKFVEILSFPKIHHQQLIIDILAQSVCLFVCVYVCVCVTDSLLVYYLY